METNGDLWRQMELYDSTGRRAIIGVSSFLTIPSFVAVWEASKQMYDRIGGGATTVSVSWEYGEAWSSMQQYGQYAAVRISSN